MTSYKSSTKGRQNSSAFVHGRFRVLGMKHFFIFYAIHLLIALLEDGTNIILIL